MNIVEMWFKYNGKSQMWPLSSTENTKSRVNDGVRYSIASLEDSGSPNLYILSGPLISMLFVFILKLIGENYPTCKVSLVRNICIQTNTNLYLYKYIPLANGIVFAYKPQYKYKQILIT